MTKEEALQLVKENIQNQNLIKHMLASEAIMKALAKKFGKDEKLWGIIGLLHDLDFEKTKDTPEKHGLVTAEMLKDKVDETIIRAIKSHNDLLGVPRETDLEHALASSEQLTGLIVGCALVMPDKKLASVRPETILKKFKDKSFTANVRREIILECEKLDLNLEDFVKLGLEAMQGIAGDLGL